MINKKKFSLIVISILTLLIASSATISASSKSKVKNKVKSKKTSTIIAKKTVTPKVIKSTKVNTIPKTSPKKNTVINNYQQYYDAIKNALNNYENSITFYINNYNEKIYNLNTVNKASDTIPKLGGVYLGATASITYSKPTQLTINFKYSDSKSNLLVKEKNLNQKISEIIAKTITPNMKDYEKELALHDYLVDNSSYDKRVFTGNMPHDSYTAYGVLINGTGVCQGYAEAMNMLLKACGIESMLVIGQANNENGWIPHAWNIVKIDGKYYHLDVTWDDPFIQDGSNIMSHSYFNITDDKISKNHTWERNQYPECNATTYSFDNLNVAEKTPEGDVIIKVKNYDEFYNEIKSALSGSKKSVSLKITNYQPENYDISSTVKRIYKELSLSGSYSWSHYNDEISNSEYVTINFDK